MKDGIKRNKRVDIIGAGLAGSEAAWQASRMGVPVRLFEMRPEKMTPAHKTPYFAELVCSNSLRSDALANAVGLLKEEMRRLGSLIMECAEENRVPAGSALAVDREGFSRMVTERLESSELIEIVREEITEVPQAVENPLIIATGPLTSESLAASVRSLVGEDYLYFYDAAAPVVTRDSLNFEKLFWASRYGKGDSDYLNAPMDEEEYNRFWEALVTAERHPLKEFEKEIFFEGCMPVEEMARRGRETLLYGPLKPVGIINPRTGKKPYANVQLRIDNKDGSLFNIVGFQTNLKWGEQERVFRMIPGLDNAEFVRYGVMHKNIFINSPKVLKATLQLAAREDILFAGQITGVEGYVESAASGLVAGVNAARIALGEEPLVFPPETVIGSMQQYITYAEKENFQPMNANFGLLPPVEGKVRKKERKDRMAERALVSIMEFKKIIHG